MSKKYDFSAVLLKGSFGGTYADFPYDSIKEFGSRKPVRVKATFDGYEYSMNLLPNGKGGHWLHLKKEIRQLIGKEEGDDVEVTIELDTTKPKIEIPEYLEWLLNEDTMMKKYFDKMPFSAKKFWIGFIEEPKNDDTKVDRINKLFDFLEKNYSGKI